MLDHRLRSVFSSVFDVDPAGLRECDTNKSIPEWDSVTHIQLMLALEEEFDLQLDAEEMMNLVSVAGIAERIGLTTE